MTNANIVSVSVNEIWDRVRARLKARIGHEEYSSWFTSAQLEEAQSNGATATVSVATPFLVNWINNTYHSVIQELWQEYQSEIKVRIVLRKRTNGEKIFDPEAHENRRRKIDPFSSIPQDKTKRPPPARKPRGRPRQKPGGVVERTTARPFVKKTPWSETPLPNEIVLEEAKLMVFENLAKPGGRITIELCRQFVMHAYAVSFEELASDSRKNHALVPRQIGMYLAKKYTSHAHSEIGRWFGGRDHSTVSSAIQRIDELRADNMGIDLLMVSLLDHFGACVELSNRTIVEVP